MGKPRGWVERRKTYPSVVYPLVSSPPFPHGRAFAPKVQRHSDEGPFSEGVMVASIQLAHEHLVGFSARGYLTEQKTLTLKRKIALPHHHLRWRQSDS